MTTTLPADPETARLAAQVATIMRQPLAAIVKEAIEATARAAGVVAPPRRRIDLDKVRAILARIDARPVLDNRSPDEIIGYDEFGLPK